MPGATLERPAPSDPAAAPALLCVANFPANTGYAWGFIEALFAGLADRLASAGVRTYVAYPAIATPPATLAGSAARAVALDVRFDSSRCIRATLDFVHRHRVRVLYLADRSAWSPVFPLLRQAGVRRIIVHDHTSGERTPPRGLRRLLKAVSRRLTPLLADDVVAVSDYVLRRKLEVDLLPRARCRRIWNSIVPPERDPGARARLRREFGLPEDALVVACASRATPEKGIHHLLQAFDTLAAHAVGAPRLLYLGDGPALPHLRELHASLRHRDRILLAGHRTDAAALLAGADLCAVPSVWQEAFGLAALEPMAAGVPVVATRAGGLPEVVQEGVTGLLVAPGDEPGLARALDRLLADRTLRQRLGVNGRRRARERFSRAGQIAELAALVAPGLGLAGAPEEVDSPAPGALPAVAGALSGGAGALRAAHGQRIAEGK